ncbi:DUF7108 family protein [Salinigranum halophilum]|uniref:DUF7108 family protein n=1 Tax=Salinigranum halophilum TaxID=2565931 RepID=UPI0010A8241F|nr:rnhA operon protein [Salinigranum halophilum]
MAEDLPDELLDEAERLTRLARDVPNPEEAAAHRDRRDELLAEHGYTARYREDDDTLVLNPSDWFEDGVARTERMDDLSRAVERSLSGAGADDEWQAVEADNADLVERLGEEHGAVHAANARAFADFMGNHYTRRIEAASGREVKEFLEEYYPRNAWPTAEQKAVIEESLGLLFDAAGCDRPSYR